jgi:hypothetical protein
MFINSSSGSHHIHVPSQESKSVSHSLVFSIANSIASRTKSNVATISSPTVIVNMISAMRSLPHNFDFFQLHRLGYLLDIALSNPHPILNLGLDAVTITQSRSNILPLYTGHNLASNTFWHSCLFVSTNMICMNRYRI